MMATTAPRKAPGAAASTAVAKREGTLTQFIETYQGDFSRVMPKHVSVEAFVGLAGAYVRRDDKLREAANANPASLILALRECAALGHTPVPKVFALVPFKMRGKNGAPDTWAITGIETYHGVIERMYRAGGVQSVKCELVREGDEFEWDPMNQRVVRHRYDPFADEAARGQLMGVYAWAVLFTGGMSQVVWMNRAEVMKHRAVSRSGDAFWGGPWEPAMWRKTALHGLETYVPTSAEYRWQVALSGNAAGSGFAGIPDVPVLEYGPSPDDGIQDAVVIDDEPAATQSPRPRVPDEDGRSGPTGAGDPPASNTGTGWPKVPPIPNGDRTT